MRAVRVESSVELLQTIAEISVNARTAAEDALLLPASIVSILMVCL